MDQQEWIQVKRVVAEALALEPSQRQTYLRTACKGDKKLIAEAKEQLRAITQSEEENFLEKLNVDQQTFIQDLARRMNQTPASGGFIGQAIGPYKITEQLGSGGMGAVYKAERVDGVFHHTVAIKLLKKNVTSTETLQRFRQEREILGNLHHPGITQLYDGGVTADGVPYLIMEYVNGKPIDTWCDEKRLSIKERLKLFGKVCQAVQFAHQHMVIHRDLKPQNIFVTITGRVKIFDFGIAKILKPAHPDQEVMQTKTGDRLWTPQFAAPEQISGNDISIATDVYALGALLYSLLTGSYGYDFTGKSTYEIESMILKDDPPSPDKSAAQANQEIVKSRQLNNSKQLQKILRGDLNAIISKAMRKQARFRYLSVSELLDDLHRYASYLPLHARERNWHYRSSKFWQRHKIGALVAALFVGIMIIYIFQITRERNQAQLEARKAQEVTSFLTDMFQANDPDVRQGKTITAIQLLKKGEQKIDQLNNQPEIKSAMLEVIGNLYSQLSKYDKADSLLGQSLTLKKTLFRPSDPELASGYYSLALNTERRGALDSSKILLRHAITLQKRLYGLHNQKLAQSLTEQSRIYELDGKLDSAYSSIQMATSIYKNNGDTLTKGYDNALYNKAAILIQMGDYRHAEKIQRASLALSQNLYKPPHSAISDNMDNLARILQRLGKFSKAESLYVRAMEMDKELYGSHHITYATSINNLAGLYYYMGKYPKSDSMYARSSRIMIAVLGEHHTGVAINYSNRGNLKLRIKQYAQAEHFYRKAIDIFIPLVGEKHPGVATTYDGLGIALMKQHRYHEAETYLKKTLHIRQAVYKNKYHPYIGQIKQTLAVLMFKTNRIHQARQLVKESLICFVKSYGRDSDMVKKKAASFSKLLAQHNISISRDSLITMCDT